MDKQKHQADLQAQAERAQHELLVSIRSQFAQDRQVWTAQMEERHMAERQRAVQELTAELERTRDELVLDCQSRFQAEKVALVLHVIIKHTLVIWSHTWP